MDGWLIKTTAPGLAPDTRPIVEVWAAWESDAVNAVSAVELASGLGDPPAETLAAVSADALRGMGLRQKGDVHRVRADF